MKQVVTFGLFSLLIFIAGLALFSKPTHDHNWGDDFAAYIMQAKSIVDGSPQAFVEANRFTTEQSSYLIPNAYPWGFPLMLAPFYALWGLNLVALKAVSKISYLLLLVVLWFGFRKVHLTPWFLCLMCLFTLNPYLISFSEDILSDLPFLLLSTLCILLIQTIVVENKHIVSNFWSYFLIGFGITSAFLIRTNGILLLITLGISQVVSYLQKQLQSGEAILKYDRPTLSLIAFPFYKRISIKSLLLHLTPYVVFFCSITLWGRIFPDGGASYIDQLKDFSIHTLVSNFVYYLKLPARFFMGIPYYKVLYIITIPLVIAGAARRYKFDYPAIIYLILTFILISIWPHRQGLRFLFPILPFYISFVLFGLDAFYNRMVWGQIRRPLCYFPVALVILFFGFWVLNNTYLKERNNDKITNGPFGPTAQEMFTFISNNTKSTDTIIFFKPRLMRLITDRQSIAIYVVDQLIRGDYLSFYLKTKGGQVSQDQLESLITKDDVGLIFENHDFKVYQLKNKNH
ncbi:hypothetical protein ACFLZ5_00955 [Thermodesulfobacteriota bacterium]